MKTSTIPLILSLLFLVIFIVPVFYLIYGAMFFETGTQSLTLETLIAVLTSSETYEYLLNTFVFAFGGAIISVGLATIYAWIVVRTNVPGKRLLQLLPILPLTMPFVVKAFAWIYLFSSRTGLVNLGLAQLFGKGTAFFDIYSMAGMIFCIGTGGIPLAYLTIEPAMKSFDPALEEASRVSGRGVIRTLQKVTLPVLLPAILSAFILLSIIGMENFDYPLLIGTPAGIRTLSTEVFYWLFDSLPPRYGTAAIYSIIFVLLTLSAVLIYLYVTRKAFKFVVVTGKAARPSVHQLRRWKYVALAICFLIMFFAFVLPYSTLVFMSFTTYLSAGGGVVAVNFTLQNYVNALNLPLFFSAMANSIFLGLAAGSIGTLIAALLSYAALKSKAKGARFIELISSIPLALPGIVYGLALYWTFLLVPIFSDLIYGTIWPLVIALVCVRLPYCVRMISGNLIQISNELEESSRVSGGSWGRTFYRIMLPLMRNGMVNSFLYTFVNSLRELGAVVLLVTPTSIVLTTLLVNLHSQHPMTINVLASAAIILSVFIITALAINGWLPGFLDSRKVKKSEKK